MKLHETFHELSCKLSWNFTMCKHISFQDWTKIMQFLTFFMKLEGQNGVEFFSNLSLTFKYSTTWKHYYNFNDIFMYFNEGMKFQKIERAQKNWLSIFEICSTNNLTTWKCKCQFNESTLQYLKASILKSKVCHLIHIKRQIYIDFFQV